MAAAWARCRSGYALPAFPATATTSRIPTPSDTRHPHGRRGSVLLRPLVWFLFALDTDRAELVTDNAAALRERFEAVTRERISALEGIDEAVRSERELSGKASLDRERPDREMAAPSSLDKAPEPEPPAREKRTDMDMGI